MQYQFDCSRHKLPYEMQYRWNWYFIGLIVCIEREIETVVVSGIRASLGKSIEVKREATAVVDVISSDKNVAEALQRVGGASISRELGEGERVPIRGPAPY